MASLLSQFKTFLPTKGKASPAGEYDFEAVQAAVLSVANAKLTCACNRLYDRDLYKYNFMHPTIKLASVEEWARDLEEELPHCP